jgi:hypothetical protein
MELVLTREQMHSNIAKLSEYLEASDGPEADFARELIQRGTCFVVTSEVGKPFFSPSRFVGYQDNNRRNHQANAGKDGRDTNEAIELILGSEPKQDPECESEYAVFCLRLGLQMREAGSFGATRKYWDLREAG